MAIIVSKQIYIGFQKRHEGESWNTPKKDCKEVLLGFATYYEENAKFEKRKETIDSWASGRYWQKIDALPSKIIDNDLLGGFQIAREVRRDASWGGGNVVWRIEDPRGFELEISSANMAAIMDCSTIVNGEIQGKCKWGWNTTGGSKVVLLPEHSEPYQQAIEDTKRHNSNVSIKEVSLGDQVELKNGTVGTYLGYHHFLRTDWSSGDYDRYDYQRNLRVLTKSKKKNHFFRMPGNHRILMVPSPKLAKIVARAKKEITLEEGAARINKALRSRYRVDTLTRDGEPVIFVSPKPIKDDDYRTVLQPVTYTVLQELIDDNVTYNSPTIPEHENIILTFTNESTWMIEHARPQGILDLQEVYRVKLLNGQRETKLKEQLPTQSQRFSYGARSWQVRSEQKINIKDLEHRAVAHQVLIEYNNERYPTRY